MRCKSKVFSVFLVAMVGWLEPSLAETLEDRISAYQELMKTTCLVGEAEFENFQIDVDVDGNLTLEGLGGQSITVDEQQVRGNTDGAVSYIDEELRKTVETEMRQCMISLVPQVLDAINAKGFQCSVDLWGFYWGSYDASIERTLAPTGNISFPATLPNTDVLINKFQSPGGNKGFCRTDSRCRVQAWAAAFDTNLDQNVRDFGDWVKKGCSSAKAFGRPAYCCIDPAQPNPPPEDLR